MASGGKEGGAGSPCAEASYVVGQSWVGGEGIAV
jgi:hypothetical protein